MLRFEGRSIAKGTGIGPLLITDTPISFLGGVDPKTGIVIGKSITGKVLVFPYGKGSTVGSYVLYALVKNHVAPAAIINTECETIIATGAIISEISTVDRLKGDLPTDGVVTVDGTNGTVSFA